MIHDSASNERKNEKSTPVHTVEIKTLVFEGKGLGHLENGKTAFVAKTLPGETVEFEVLSKKRDFLQGWPKKILKKSKDRVEAECPYFDRCGGCSFQNMSYEKQLYWKQRFLDESLDRIGKFSESDIEKWKQPIIGATNLLHYRNKTEFSFSDKDGKLEVGFHNPVKRFHLLKHDRCLLHSPNAQKAFEVIQELVKKSDFDVYNLYENRKGFLFSITFRTNHKDELLVAVNTNDADFPKPEMERWQKAFEKEMGEKFVAFVQVRKDRKETGSQQEIVPLWGAVALEDEVRGLKFRIGATSFFQVNREMADRMVEKLRHHLLDIVKDVLVLDLFCGNGFLGMALSKVAKSVIGIEMNSHAVEEGKTNLILNDIKNYKFYEGDARKVLNKLLDQRKRFDCVVVDPPRCGMGRRTAKTVAKAGANNMLYVSCNPTTLARDLQYLTLFGYEIVSTQVLDLFPQTYHLETVVRLKKVKEYAQAKQDFIDGGGGWK